MSGDLESARRAVRRGLRVMLAGVVAMAVTYVVALKFTPMEKFQGMPQKIFYLHAPAAWSALFCFSLVGIASILYLWLKDQRLDLFAESAAAVGLVCSLAMLTTGPMWGKPVWGTWWTWDARLTFTLFLFFLFLGYRALRGAMQDREERARYSAVLGILGMVLVPFVHLTVYLFPTVHPTPIVLKPSKPSLPWEMLRTLFLGLASMTVLALGFVMSRYGIGRVAEAKGEDPDGS